MNTFSAPPHISKYQEEALIAYVETALRSPSDSDDSGKSVSSTIFSPLRGVLYVRRAIAIPNPMGIKIANNAKNT